MPKKISPILANNLKYFFKHKYGSFPYAPSPSCSDTMAASFLGYARDKYAGLLYSNHDILLSSVHKFSLNLHINLPVLFSYEAPNIFSSIFEDDYSDPDDEGYQLQVLRRSYTADDRMDAFIRNFIININLSKEKKRMKWSDFYNIKTSVDKSWLDVGNNGIDLICRASVDNILRKKQSNDCLVSTLGWIAICCGYSWADLAMLFVNNKFLEFSSDLNRLFVKDEFIDTYLLQPAE